MKKFIAFVMAVMVVMSMVIGPKEALAVENDVEKAAVTNIQEAYARCVNNHSEELVGVKLTMVSQNIHRIEANGYYYWYVAAYNYETREIMTDSVILSPEELVNAALTYDMYY